VVMIHQPVGIKACMILVTHFLLVELTCPNVTLQYVLLTIDLCQCKYLLRFGY
jgi:hypothetical protein